MGNDNSFVSGSLIIALSSIFCTGLAALCVSCYRLKCAEVNLCGLIFRRDIAGENQYELNSPLKPSTPDTVSPPTSQPPSRRGSLNYV